MEHAHINPAFDKAIARMDKLLLQMEAAVTEQISSAAAVLNEMDVVRAKAVREKDKELNLLLKEVEEQVVLTLAKHQPVAEDLRHTISALKMAIEYERAGDYVKNLTMSISRIAAHDEDLRVLPSLKKLLTDVETMFASYREARLKNDIKMAERVWLKDQKIDDLCEDSVRQAFVNEERGDGNVHSLVHSVSVAKNLERLGDKIKNLVEIFYYQKTGEELDIQID